MKKNVVVVCLVLMGVLCAVSVQGQVSFKSAYIGRSKYTDPETGSETGGKGAAQVVQGSVQLPLAMKADTVKTASDTTVHVKLWRLYVDGSYTRFDNEGMDAYNFPSQVVNGRFGFMHIRTLNAKWSVIASVGVGVYAAPAHMAANKVLGEGAVIFVRTLRPNLKVGAGITFNNTFGYPMVYPGIIVNWMLDGRYYVNLNSNEIKAGVKLKETMKLSAIFQADGALALEKNVMFTHLYYTVGIAPEFKTKKSFTVQPTVGISASRSAYAHERTISDFFSYMGKQDPPHFSTSLYFAITVGYGI